MRLLATIVTLLGYVTAPKPEPKLAPIRPHCYILRTDILTDDSPRPLLIRDWMACWRCAKFKECKEERCS